MCAPRRPAPNPSRPESTVNLARWWDLLRAALASLGEPEPLRELAAALRAELARRTGAER